MSVSTEAKAVFDEADRIAARLAPITRDDPPTELLYALVILMCGCLATDSASRSAADKHLEHLFDTARKHLDYTWKAAGRS